MSSAERDPRDEAEAPPAPESAFHAFRHAETLLGQRRAIEALRVLEPALEMEPDSPSVLLLAGRAFFHSAQLRNAQRAFERVLELDPTDHYARFILGRTLQRQGKMREALGQLRMAYAMNPLADYQDALTEVAARLKLSS